MPNFVNIFFDAEANLARLKTVPEACQIWHGLKPCQIGVPDQKSGTVRSRAKKSGTPESGTVRSRARIDLARSGAVPDWRFWCSVRKFLFEGALKLKYCT